MVGLIAIFTLQETPAKTKGWLTETDKRFLALRTRYMYGGGASKAKDEFVWADVVEAVKVSPLLDRRKSKADFFFFFQVCPHLDSLPYRYLQHHGTIWLCFVTSYYRS